ncbi:MAG: hypothetical protein MUO31_05460 [Thermodesulfovibrionales bacterium]|nr:hypothetical protein [Thermodesulfovibrionales bacterium]
MMLNTVAVLIAVVALILLIIALVYIYTPVKDVPDVDEIKKAQKTAGGLAIGALFAVVVLGLVNIFQLAVNKKLKTCLDPNQTMPQ